MKKSFNAFDFKDGREQSSMNVISLTCLCDPLILVLLVLSAILAVHDKDSV